MSSLAWQCAGERRLRAVNASTRHQTAQFCSSNKQLPTQAAESWVHRVYGCVPCLPRAQ